MTRAGKRQTGMLITVEGIDGSGKTSAVEVLADRFPDAVITSEPTESWYGDAVRRSIQDTDANSLAELFLYTADHADHLERVILPALERGQLVISDRYSDSRYAYQGATLADRFDDPVAFVRSIHRPWTSTPDVTIYLDVPPAIGAERSGGTTKFEDERWLTTVSRNYERLIDDEPERFRRIDATEPPAAVGRAVCEAVETAKTNLT